VSNKETPTEGRGLLLRPPSSSVWLSVSEWIPMQILSRGLRVVFRNPESKRTCEIKYVPNSEKWHVTCYITDDMTTNFSNLRPWPHKERNMEGGMPMLNSYDSLMEALEAFKEWTK